MANDQSTSVALISPEHALSMREQAHRALRDCATVFDAMDVRAKAAAVRAYSKAAKDRSLEIEAVAIRTRAERRLGQMLAEGRERGEVATRGKDNLPKGSNAQPVEAPTLSDIGVSKQVSARSGILARMTGRYRGLAALLMGRRLPGRLRVLASFNETPRPLTSLFKSRMASPFSAISLPSLFDSAWTISVTISRMSSLVKPMPFLLRGPVGGYGRYTGYAVFAPPYGRRPQCRHFRRGFRFRLTRHRHGKVHFRTTNAPFSIPARSAACRAAWFVPKRGVMMVWASP